MRYMAPNTHNNLTLRVRLADGTWAPFTGNLGPDGLAEVSRGDWRPVRRGPAEG